jgi:ankyrin repeat protein
MQERKYSIPQIVFWCLFSCLFVLMILVFAGYIDLYTEDSGFQKLCRNGSLQEVTDAIKAGEDVNLADKYGHTPLMMASKSNSNPEVIEALIKAGADINAKSNYGETPLLLAAEKNTNQKVIITLLNLGADPRARDNRGRGAIDWARRNHLLRNTDAYRMLEEKIGIKNRE